MGRNAGTLLLEQAPQRPPLTIALEAEQARPRLRLLGSFAVVADGETMSLPSTVERLLALLALHRRPLQRSFAAGTLWPESGETRAGGNLRTTLWRCHQLPVALVHVDGHLLRLPEGIEVDVFEVAARCQRLLDGVPLDEIGGLRPEELSQDLLPDWYEDWVLLEQERFRQLRLHTLDALCRRLTAAGRFASAVQAGLAAVAAEPLRESGHRVLIEAHLAEHNLVEAVRHYRWYRDLLHAELGVQPSPKLTALVQGLAITAASNSSGVTRPRPV